MVRRLNLPGSVLTEPSVPQLVPRVRSFNLPTGGCDGVGSHGSTSEVDSGPVHQIKKFDLPAAAPASEATKVVKVPQTKSPVDTLIEAIGSIDASIEPMRVRTRLQSLLATGINGILDWGAASLTPLQAATSIQGQIASRMAQINPSGWINDTLEASSKKPSFMDLLAKKPGAVYYENMIKKCRGELMQLVNDLTTMGANYEPKVRDLQLDAITMLVVANSTPYDDANNMIASNRARSLQQAHQTASLLIEHIKVTKLQIAKYIQQIDDLMNITLPNWKMAEANK